MVDKSTHRVQQMFADIAARYDLLNHLLTLNIDKYWRWLVVRAAPPVGDAPILDVCTGTGDLALAYDRAAAGRSKIVAADFCEPMLAIGREKALRSGSSERIEFIAADTENLPLANDTFQVVSVAFGLRNVADTDRGLREMTRVCRPGGKVVVLECTEPTMPVFRTLHRWYFRHLVPFLGRIVSGRRGAAAYKYLPESVSEFVQGDALLQKMRAAGLSDCRCLPLTGGVAMLYLGTK
jgi:demethylmenaquinone methyltransferase/2-methoxy-6-polyprenyl-1,4-benzoquinol methylase